MSLGAYRFLGCLRLEAKDNGAGPSFDFARVACLEAFRAAIAVLVRDALEVRCERPREGPGEQTSGNPLLDEVSVCHAGLRSQCGDRDLCALRLLRRRSGSRLPGHERGWR